MKNFTYLDALAELEIGGAHPGGIQLTKQLLENEVIHFDSKILDAGCGTGLSSAFIAKQFKCEVHALDQNDKMILRAKEELKHLKNAKVHAGSFENMPFESASFDFVLSESVMSFLPVQKALKETYRVLKNNGVLLLNEMTVIQPLTPIEQKNIYSFYAFKQLLKENEWYSSLKNSGFSKVERIVFENPFNTANLEVHLPRNVHKQSLDILDEHDNLANRFKDKLHYIVLRCKK